MVFLRSCRNEAHSDGVSILDTSEMWDLKFFKGRRGDAMSTQNGVVEQYGLRTF